jgi:hypothetical protein
MKKLILAVLLLRASTLFGQESLHCIPLSESRVIHERALKSIGLDIIVNEQAGKIVILENSLLSQHESFTKELTEEREKLQLQKEITAHTESISNTYQEEKKSLKKQVRRLKWQRIGLGVIAVAAIGLSL